MGVYGLSEGSEHEGLLFANGLAKLTMPLCCPVSPRVRDAALCREPSLYSTHCHRVQNKQPGVQRFTLCRESILGYPSREVEEGPRLL